MFANSMKHLALKIIFLTAACIVQAQPTTPVATIDASKTGPPISPYVYGQFLEQPGSLVYGSLWCEMLDDRKFYYDVTNNVAEDANAGQRGSGGFGPGDGATSVRDDGILSARLIPLSWTPTILSLAITRR